MRFLRSTLLSSRAGIFRAFLIGFLVNAGVQAQDADQNAPKAKVPGRSELRKAEKSIRDLFKAEYRSKDLTEYRSFARRLLAEGEKPQEEPALQYTLLAEASEFAAKAQDLATSFSAIDRMAEHFEIDPFKEKLSALAVARKAGRRPDDLARTAIGGIRLAEQARMAGNFDAAAKSLKEAGTAARAARDAGISKQVTQEVRLTVALKKEYDRVAKARKKLEDSPDDRPANLTLGRWVVFRQHDFSEGLPLLVKGSDSKLAKAAKLDLEGFDALEIGEAWMSLTANPALSRDVLVERACSWLRKAWSDSTGRNRERLRGRLGQILITKGGAPPKPGVRPPGWPKGMGTYAWDGSRSWSGQFSVKLMPHPLNAQRKGFTAVDSERFPAAPGTEYRVSVMALTEKTGATGRIDIGVFIAFRGTEQKPILEQSIPFPVDTPVWTRVERTFTCPPGARMVSLSFHMAEPEGAVWVDGVSLVCEGKELLPNGGFEK